MKQFLFEETVRMPNSNPWGRSKNSRPYELQTLRYTVVYSGSSCNQAGMITSLKKGTCNVSPQGWAFDSNVACSSGLIDRCA